MEKTLQQIQDASKQEALQLVIVCATDIFTAWPQLTLRDLRSMTNKIDTLRQAVNEYKKYM